MSKKKIDETMTQARTAKRKKDAELAEVEVETPAEQSAPTKRRKTRPLAIVPDQAPLTEPGGKTKGKPAKETVEEKTPKEDLVVFAFRLRAAERDLIHRAAGAARASKFVRALTIAASKGDEKAVTDIVRAVKAGMTAAS